MSIPEDAVMAKLLFDAIRFLEAAFAVTAKPLPPDRQSPILGGIPEENTVWLLEHPHFEIFVVPQDNMGVLKSMAVHRDGATRWLRLACYHNRTGRNLSYDSIVSSMEAEPQLRRFPAMIRTQLERVERALDQASR